MNISLRKAISQILLVGSTAAFAAGALAGLGQQNPPPGPGQVPDYFGIVPNFANSPQPVMAVVSGGTGTGAAATTYDYSIDAQTPKIMDVQGGAGYQPNDVLTITGGGLAAAAVTCDVTVNTVDGAGAIIPDVDLNNVVIPGVTIPDACTGFTTPILNTGIRKFVDSLPGLNAPNNLGQQLPVAVADTTTFAAVGTTPAADYYEIAEVEYTQQLHSDLPPTHLRGYVQIKTGGFNVATYTGLSGAAKLAYASQYAGYLGPVIVAQKDKPVRIKLTNLLSTGAAGKLPMPVDTTYMGADSANATDNRAALHLHGGNTPWISDGTPRQWVKPAGEAGDNKGATVRDVPDMWFTTDANGKSTGVLAATCQGSSTCADPSLTNNPGDGSMTFYFTNQQSARLMFYHDHAEGITRLNVYAGVAAGYVLQDKTEQALVAAGTLPPLADTIPLVIQEKTFVPNNTQPVMNFYAAFASQLQSQDPTWRWGTTGLDGNGKIISSGPNGNGDLWVPHVFMPNQNPGDITGGNAMGRWDYGPWFWPPFTAISNGPITNPYFDPLCDTTLSYCEPATIPGVPNGSFIANGGGVTDAMTGVKTESPSGTPEAFNDTPLVNGTAYPYINVDPKKYRLRILSVGNDRMLNLSLVVAASKNSVTTADANAGRNGVAKMCNGRTAESAFPENCTEVKMVPFTSTQNLSTPFPAWWYTSQKGGVTFDGRPSGVFDPKTRGPAMVQIGTEGGFLSSPVVIKNQPVNYEYNPKNILIGNIKQHALLLGPAERADVLVDFSKFAGSTLILYNDAGAPVPAWDLRLDYYTGNFDNTDTGGAFSTIPGYGPNSRTIMQIRVASTCASANCGSTSSTSPVDDLGRITMANLTPAIQKAFRESQEPIIVPQAAYNPVYGTNVPDSLGTDLSRIADYQLTFKPIADANPPGLGTPAILEATAVTMDMSPKTIIEDWTMNWGRMNALLGTEVPRTNATIQTSIPQAYIDPPTELVKITPNTNATPITGTLADGTSLWKITHNGVDSHSIHFHLFHVQLVNRVGWDGAVYPPELNELGWKDSILMHPLSDVVVALRPMTMDLPFKVANSHRKIDPSMAAKGFDYFNLNPMTGNASNVSDVTNADMNYGWEYVWHCHILGHEENDMMRSIAVAQPPEAPSVLTATTVAGTNNVKLDWTDNSVVSNWVEITRSLDGVMNGNGSAFQTVNATFDVVTPECSAQAGCARTYTDTTAAAGTSYYYRVVANNTVGGGAARADSPLVQGAGGFFTNQDTLPVGVRSLLPTVAGVKGYAGYANVTASSDAITASRLLSPTALVTAGPLTFDDQFVGVTSAAQTVTVQNTGTGNLTIASVALNPVVAPAVSNFAITNACPASLAPLASCDISVTFTPKVVGVALADLLTITDNSSTGSMQTVAMSGTGLLATPVAVVTPATLAFPATPVGSTSAPLMATLSNTGNGVLTINGITATAPFARAGGTCGTTLAAPVAPALSTTCTIGVTFAPTASGAVAPDGMLTIADDSNNAVSTQTVTLTGSGVAPAPIASVTGPLTFGNVNVGTISAAQTVTLSNTGSAPLNISSIVAPAQFAQTNNCPLASLATNATCAISVTFAPTAAGPAAGDLVISDNSGNVASTQTVSLSGAGVALPTGPAAPTNVVIQRTSATRATLSWVDASNNETSFRVETSVDGGANWANLGAAIARTGGQIGATGGAVTAPAIVVSNTTNALYRVNAINAIGTGTSASVSLNDTVAPLAPTDLTATATRNRITLSWADAANNNVSYNIQRASDALFTVNVNNNTSGANSTGVTQTGRTPNRTYYYRVQAVNSVGVSAWVVLTPPVTTLP